MIPPGQTPVVYRKHIIVRADVPNRNNRVYSAELCRQMVKQFKERDAMIGTLDGEPDQAITKFSDASHRVKDLIFHEHSKTLEVKIETLQTPAGKVLKALLDDNVDIQFRPVGVGGIEYQQDGSILIDHERYKFLRVDAMGEAGLPL